MNKSECTKKSGEKKSEFSDFHTRLRSVCDESTRFIESINKSKDSMCQKKHRLMKILADKTLFGSLYIPSRGHNELVQIENDALYFLNNIEEFNKAITSENNMLGHITKNIEKKIVETRRQLMIACQEYDNVTSLISMNNTLHEYALNILSSDNNTSTLDDSTSINANDICFINSCSTPAVPFDNSL